MDCKAFLAAAAALFALAPAASAQILTDEEILNRFLIQRDAYAAVKSGTGATRGLKIVTVEDLGPSDVAVNDTPAPQPEQPSSEGEVVVTGGDTDPVPQPDPTPLPGVELAAAEVGILPEDLQVNIRITFDYDSATIKDDQKPVLDQMCRVIKASDIKLFRIMGHTDSAGSDAYNQELSLSRAEEVKRRLVSDCGIDAARLEPMGLGERFLADPEDPTAAENRRVEFQALS
jgi:outer membrane protein OmpA-like peptidoglycan-associated protein